MFVSADSSVVKPLTASPDSQRFALAREPAQQSVHRFGRLAVERLAKPIESSDRSDIPAESLFVVLVTDSHAQEVLRARFRWIVLRFGHSGMLKKIRSGQPFGNWCCLLLVDGDKQIGRRLVERPAAEPKASNCKTVCRIRRDTSG